LNFIFGIVCLFVCVCAFSLRRESPDMILGDKPLIFEVVLSQSVAVPDMWPTTLVLGCNHTIPAFLTALPAQSY
jgi:hypothetical protein